MLQLQLQGFKLHSFNFLSDRLIPLLWLGSFISPSIFTLAHDRHTRSIAFASDYLWGAEAHKPCNQIKYLIDSKVYFEKLINWFLEKLITFKDIFILYCNCIYAIVLVILKELSDALPNLCFCLNVFAGNFPEILQKSLYSSIFSSY